MTRAALTRTGLQITLDVLAELHRLDEKHPDFIAVRRATAHMFKAAKKSRRLEKRAKSPGRPRGRGRHGNRRADRIDDETRGIPLATSTTAPSAGTSSGRVPATSANSTTRPSTRSTTSCVRNARP